MRYIVHLNDFATADRVLTFIGDTGSVALDARTIHFDQDVFDFLAAQHGKSPIHIGRVEDTACLRVGSSAYGIVVRHLA